MVIIIVLTLQVRKFEHLRKLEPTCSRSNSVSWGAMSRRSGHISDRQVVLPPIVCKVHLHKWHKRGFRMDSYPVWNFNLIMGSREEKERDYWYHKHIFKSYHQTCIYQVPVYPISGNFEHTNSSENRWKLWRPCIQKFSCSFKDFTISRKVVQISQFKDSLWYLSQFLK